MNDGSAAQVLVVLTAPPEIGDLIVDWLLARDVPLGFTSSLVSGHSTNHEGLSTAEQVRGRQNRLQFQVQMPADASEEFLAEAAASIAAAGVHYWVVPVIAGGHLSR